MSAENEALVRRLFDEVLNGNNPAAADGVLADVGSNHGPALIGIHGGRDGFTQTLSLFRRAMPDLEFTIALLMPVEDSVVVHWQATGTLTESLGSIRANGRSATVTGTVVYRIGHGRIAESWGNWDALGLLEQLGAAGPPPLP